MIFDAKKILCCATALLAVAANAAGFYGNQSDIKWKTADTKHFQFIYPQEYTEHASVLSSYAEAVYDSVVGRYKKDLPGRVNAVLNNALYSNGSAVPGENAVNLWLTNWDFKVRSSHGWLADVITHEFSHLVSIENGSKILPSIYGLQIGYTDYYNERITSDFSTFIPFTLQPLWFAEGTAQFESARMGFDAWDTHRDMLLRVAALNDSLLPLEYMHNFSDNSLFAELGPYTQGFALVRYIAKHYGENAIPKIWTELSRPYRVTLDGALKKAIGISEKELYAAWKKEITEAYKAQKDSLGTLVEGKKITADAFWQDFPVVAGKHLYGVSNFGGLWFDGAVFKMPLTPDSTAKDAPADTAANKIDGIEIGQISIEEETDEDSTINIGDYAKSGFRAKKPWFDKGIDVYNAPEKGPILAYVTFQNRDKDGHAHFDIAVSDTNKNKLNLTYLVDAVYPAFNRQGTEVVFVRREPHSTRFVLSKVPFTANFDEYTSEDPIDIFVPDAKYRYYNIYSPKYSPDGMRIAFSFFDDVHRGIAVIDSDGKNMKILSSENFDERDVNWIDDNRIVFASNRNGIFNLIEKDLATGAERALTNVIGGAFTPVLAGDTPIRQGRILALQAPVRNSRDGKRHDGEHLPAGQHHPGRRHRMEQLRRFQHNRGLYRRHANPERQRPGQRGRELHIRTGRHHARFRHQDSRYDLHHHAEARHQRNRTQGLAHPAHRKAYRTRRPRIRRHRAELQAHPDGPAVHPNSLLQRERPRPHRIRRRPAQGESGPRDDPLRPAQEEHRPAGAPA